MNKDEILAKAKRDYPIGTIFECHWYNDGKMVYETADVEPYWYCGHGIAVQHRRGVIYHAKEGWSRIISKPKGNLYKLY